jgi:hypothetical protein
LALLAFLLAAIRLGDEFVWLSLRLRVLKILATSAGVTESLRAGLLWTVEPTKLMAVVWILLVGVLAYRIPPGASQASPPSTAAPPGRSGECAAREDKMHLDHFAARRKMPVNYRIGANDLAWESGTGKSLAKSDFVGRYTGCPVDIGDPVIPTELEPQPAVKASSGKSAIPVPVDGASDLARALNPGVQVDVFDGMRPVVSGAGVLALQCDSPDSATCAVLLDLPMNDAMNLLRTDPGKLKLILVKP